MNSSRDSQTTDANETAVTDSQLSSQMVADILAYHMGAASNPNKIEELVLVIGRAQAGKSVFVNALCGVKFDFNDSGRLEPLSELVTPIGDEEKGSFDCTMFPSAHFSEMLNEHLIDTPGYLGVGGPELKIAKEQSIRFIIQNASRVKIVFLVDCNDFDNIHKLTHTVIEILGSLHIGDRANIPIYLLLNKFRLTQGQIKKYYSLPSTEEKSKFLHQKVHDKLEGAVGMVEEYCRRLNNRLEPTMAELNESGKSDDEIVTLLHQNADFQEMTKSMQTVMFLMNTLENNNWGYFDPTDSQSIEQTVQGIRGMRSVASNEFNIMYPNEWALVKRFLEEKLLEYKEWLVAVKTNKKYPKAFFEHYHSILDKTISERSNELNDWKNKRNVPALIEKYNSEMGSRIKATEKEIDVMREDVEKLKEERKSMENKIVVLYEERWNKEGSLSDYGSHIVTYPYSKAQGYPVDIPIVDRKIDISEPTKKSRDDYRPEEAVSITEYYSVSPSERIDESAKAPSDSSSDDTGTAATSTVSSFDTCTTPAVSTESPFALSSELTEGIDDHNEHEENKKQSCTGTVTFYGKESDKEWATYAVKGRMISAYEKEIAKKEQELNDLCAANESSVEKKLQNDIDASERQKEELSSLHKKITNRIESSPQEVRCAFVEDGQVLSKTMSFAEKLELVYRFCKMLAATTEATENIETFITMYEESQKQETLSEILMPTLADIHKQCTEMGDELNMYNGMKQ